MRAWVSVAIFACAGACGDDARTSDTDGGTHDGAVVSTAGCGAIGALCGWQTDAVGNAINCGLCRWQREAVAEEGWSVAMVMGEGDSVDALYFNSAGLMHASRNASGNWTYQTVAELVTERGITSPRLVRHEGGLTAVFISPSQSVWLAEYDGERWSTINGIRAGEYADVAVANDGTRHIVWTIPGGNLAHVTGRDGSFSANDVVAESARAMSIALDADGAPHVAWSDWNQNLRYATKTGERTWAVEDVAGRSRHAGGNGRPQIDISSIGEPWVAHDAIDHAQVARRRGGSWLVEDIDTDNSLFTETVLAARLGFVLGRNDRPFVGLSLQASFNDDSFVVATPDDDLWGRQPIVPVGGADPYATIALDLATSGEPASFFASEDVGVGFMMPVAAYSSEHEVRCLSLATQIYDDACACDETCCHGPPGSTRSTCCTGAGCSGDTRAKLCGDPTRLESDLVMCEQSLSEAMCGPIASGEQDALALPETCLPPRD